MVVKKSQINGKLFVKSNVIQISHRMKTFIKASCANNMRNGENIFLQLPLSKVCGSPLFRQSKKNVSFGLCLSFLCIFCGKKTKEMLLLRGKLSFVHVDFFFDMTKCKFIVKNNSLKHWLSFRLFLWRTQKSFSFLIW